MNISMQLFLVLAACLCLSEGAPDGRVARKQQRPTRGFKNVEMMTARGFGKRDRPHARAELVDMDDFLETLASSPEKEIDADDKNVGSMPLDLLVMEMMNNPEFTRSVVRKFIDVNKDDMLSLDELLRNVA